MIRALKKCNMESRFRHLLTKLKVLAPTAFWDYFQNTYVCCSLRNDHIGPYLPSCICATRGWANIGERTKYPSVDRDETTNLIEHFFKKFKNDFLDRRIHRRLSDLHQLIFDEVIPHYLKNMMKKKANRIKSHHQHLINMRKIDVEQLLAYDNAITSIHYDTGQARVVSGSKQGATHMVCLAEMRCTCINASKKEAVCKHLEAAFYKYGYNRSEIIPDGQLDVIDVNDTVNDIVNDVNDTVNDTMIPHESDKSFLCARHATDALVDLYMNGTITVTTEDKKLNLFSISSILTTSSKTFFIDLEQRLCSCLHSQIYGYCAHLLLVANHQRDVITVKDIREHMELITANFIDISYWRHIGRDDEEIDFEIPEIDNNPDNHNQMISADFEPSHIGSDRARCIATLLETMTPADRTVVDAQLMDIESFCEQRQAVPIIRANPSKKHNGNRQDSDRVTKPLFKAPRKKRRKPETVIETLQNVEDYPELPKVKRKTKRANIPTEELYEAYKDLPNSSLVRNLNIVASSKSRRNKYQQGHTRSRQK
jgi:hypothetical protein